MNNEATFVADIQKAQLEFEKSMCLLLKTADLLERDAAQEAAKAAPPAHDKPAATEPQTPTGRGTA
jgi:hypothetical protein